MLDFLKGAFSDNGTPSSSRIMSAVCTLAVIGWITHIVLHTHTVPDGVTMGGVTAFGVSHYAANRFTQK